MQSWTCRRLGWTASAALSLAFATSSAAAAEAVARASPSPSVACLDSAACAATPAAAIAPAGKIDPDSLLLFSVDLDKVTLTDGLAAYGDASDPLIPVGELGRLLEYDIDVSPTEKRIVGRLGEARTSLIVDLATGTARSGAKAVTLSPADVAVSASDIYLRASALQRLLPIQFKIDPQALTVSIHALEKLPVQARLERQANERFIAQRQNLPQEDVLKVPSPYHLFTPPSFDVAVQAGFQTTQLPHVPYTYDIRAGGDLFYSDFQGYVGSNEEGRPTTARVLFERRSVEGNLLGPLHARDISLGDVYTPGWTLGPRSLAGRGFTLSTIPLDQTNVFNRIDLRGELPLGYDVELYINDILQSTQNSPTKGRYEFLNVGLSRGVNVIRIVSYGPHGERSEDTRIVNVGGGQLEKGEWQFEFGAEEQEKALINLTDPLSTAFVSTGAGGWRVVGDVNYGLTDLITLNGGLALVPMSDATSRVEYTMGARTSIRGFLTQLDVAGDSHGGLAESLGLAGQIAGMSTVFRHVQLQGGFIDENGPAADFTRPLASRTELSFDGNASWRGRIVPLSLRVQRAAYTDGTSDISTTVRGSATAGPILFSTGFDYATTYGLRGGSTNQLTGFFAGSTYRNFSWQLRTTLDYDVLPYFKARDLAIVADHDINQNLSIRLGIGQNLETFQQFNLTASGVVRTKLGDLSVNGDYNNADHSWRFGAQMNFGLAYNPQKHGYQLTRQGPGTGGSVLFHAFIDKNGNGKYDEGEPPVPGVSVEGGIAHGVTDKTGEVFLTGLGNAPTARLNVNVDNVDLGSVKAPPNIIQFSPRPGQTLTIDYPMQPISEVMVRILLRRPDNTMIGISAVSVRLVSDQGKIFEAKTEFDGSANFDTLTAGTYRLELDPDQAQRLRMHLVAPVTVKIKGDGGFTPDASAEVKFDPRPDAEPAG